jgi:hypothetical protein
MESNLTLAELKRRARELGYAFIRDRTDTAPPVPLQDWPGLITDAAGAEADLNVKYDLEAPTVVGRKPDAPDAYFDLSKPTDKVASVG